MKRCLCWALVVLMFAVTLTGCKEKGMTDEDYEELIAKKAESNQKTVVMYVSGLGETYEVTLDQMLYYLAYYETKGYEYAETNSAYFATMYGDEYDFWTLAGDDGTIMKDSYKNAAYSSIIYTTIMYEEAVKAGIEAGEKRLAQLNSMVENFLSNYTLEERARCGMSEACIRENYERILVVDAYEDYVTAETKVDEEAVKATVNREDYRAYETDYLYVSMIAHDENFKELELSEEELTRRENAINSVYADALLGKDMVALRENYDDIMTYSMRDFYPTDASIEKEYISTVLEMKAGDIRKLETGAGIYVIKLIDNSKIVGYEDAVQAAIDSAKNTNVSQAFDDIEAKYEVTTSEAYDSLEMGKFYTK